MQPGDDVLCVGPSGEDILVRVVAECVDGFFSGTYRNKNSEIIVKRKFATNQVLRVFPKPWLVVSD